MSCLHHTVNSNHANKNRNKKYLLWLIFIFEKRLSTKSCLKLSTCGVPKKEAGTGGCGGVNCWSILDKKEMKQINPNLIMIDVLHI